MGKAKPTHMRPILEAAIDSGQLFNRDVRKAANWALVTIDDLTARLAEAEKLLREACDMARAPDDDPERWYGNEITDEWFDRVTAALEVKP